eukprot:TRINITY_DN48847_c0_g1_i1.p1 TRINITY_DN48847_c0_g1~~TRINITY_DN48847_c0_g1_i1.p1  ORF type:complete len:214 (-),score=35.92 TRINITY_DN48847_c0_g1_i1:241-882(-)
MVKGHNEIPHNHFKKDWQKRVRTWFDQPARKLRRRTARRNKAIKVAPRPTQLLRPAVQACTVKYARRTRLGRGFTLEELKAAGIAPRFASTIGICVDYRRRNRSEEGMARNVERLKAYHSKLVLFPKDPKKPGKADASKEEQDKAVQHTGTIMPLHRSRPAFEDRTLTGDEAKGKSVFVALRHARADARLVGQRIKVKAIKEQEAAEKAARKK